MIGGHAQVKVLSDEPKQRLWRDNYAMLMPAKPSKDEKSRLGFYINWLAETKRSWYQPDLQAYRDYLLFERTRADKKGNRKPATLSTQTVLAHLATVRGRYAALTRSNEMRDLLFELVNPNDSEAEQRAMVDEFFIRMMNDVHPAAAPVKLVAKQDTADSEHLRMKPYQVSALIQAPGIANLRGLRDTALMTLMVCTGIRAAEAASLQADDLRQHLGGELSLRVREGKGAKQRLNPLRSAELVLDVRRCLAAECRYQIRIRLSWHPAWRQNRTSDRHRQLDGQRYHELLFDQHRRRSARGQAT